MFSLNYPHKVIFGSGALGQLGTEVAARGRSALVVTGQTSMRAYGTLDRVTALLADAGVAPVTFDRVEHDPPLCTVERGVRLCRESGSEVVVGLGGGSAVDGGKAIACLANQEGSAYEYHAGREVEAPGLPFIAVPTTAGTGAEITRNAVLTDERTKLKQSIRSEYMIPDVALVDPELTLSVPQDVTAYTGADALTQAIEAFLSKASNAVTDTLALNAVMLLSSYLPKAVDDGGNLFVREKVALGSLMSAMAFSNSGLGAVHGLAHPIGAHFNVPHGLVCAVLLPHVTRFNLPTCELKFASLAAAVGARAGGEVPDTLASMLASIGIPRTLAEYGLTPDDFPTILRESRSSSMAKNPREATDEDLASILQAVTGGI